ncbi:cellulose synthase-like protein G1 [Hibiscus syriacus]|uniref:cellulose synthase-like protein G1 n=1 Tax=Hibiscus syriacus TaxID=106335 RepID=UPI0019230B37|nr:cellulose synthase-like protein G1 [Hibiscus syriacus]
MYENMKAKVENVMNRGEVGEIYINDDEKLEAFNKWKSGFTLQDHPTVIQVLLDSRHNKGITGHFLPNHIYVSRQKRKTSPHHYKVGALNVLVSIIHLHLTLFPTNIVLHFVGPNVSPCFCWYIEALGIDDHDEFSFNINPRL